MSRVTSKTPFAGRENSSGRRNTSLVRTRAALASATLLSVAFSLSACRKEPAKRTGFVPAPVTATAAPAPVAACVKSIQTATGATNYKDAMTEYYAGCADLFPKCADAWRAASKADVADQQVIVLKGCAAAYCPELNKELAVCKPDFKVTPEAFLKDNPPFFEAMIQKEAGEFSTLVTNTVLQLYLKITGSKWALPTPNTEVGGAPAASGAPAGSGAPAASGAAPGASGSAAPPAASGAAKPASGTAKPASGAKPAK